MKIIKSNSITKKILIVFVVIIMTTNFIMPNYVHAKSKSIGENLVSGIFYLLASVGDICLKTMQDFMIGEKEIKTSDNKFNIKYSPGVIFSNEVLLLDINFIDPDERTIEVADEVSQEELVEIENFKAGADRGNSMGWQQSTETVLSKEFIIGSEETAASYEATKKEILNNYGYAEATQKEGDDPYNSYSFECKWTTADGIQYELKSVYTYAAEYMRNKYIVTLTKNNTSADNSGDGSTTNESSKIQELLDKYGYNETTTTKLETGKVEGSTIRYSWTTQGGDTYVLESKRGNYDISYTVSKVVSTIITPSRTISSTANNLRNVIAKWYVALRTFALVGLLSVLLYIAIRIVLSSASANDKAKYKNMIKDWLVAVCILFVLHYIMVFILNCTDILNNLIIKTDANGTTTDTLMNTVRERIGNDLNNAGENAGYTIMYLALVILTGTFTFQYLKRVVYMAFLTMIAPLIALTYPLDKIKDSKAQAFSFWLKEYIVNCLIQPVHLLLYTVLISSAIELATENMLYSLVALAFLMPAEKITKQMFGLKSDSPVNTLTAAAGGAMVMNMLNKIKSGGPKGGKAPSEGGSGASNNGGAVRTATRNPGGNQNSSGTVNQVGTTQGSGIPLQATQNAVNANMVAANTGVNAVTGESGGAGNSGGANSSRRAGLGALASKYGSKVAKGALKGTAGLAGAAVGLSAAIADGGEGIGTRMGAGALAGTYLADRATTIPGKLKSGISNVIETYKKGAMGEEEYNNQKFDKEFYKSDGYKKILSSGEINGRYSSPEEIKARTQAFLNSGITDPKAIQSALEAGVDDVNEFKTLSDMGITDVKKYSKLKTSKGLAGSAIASRMAIAKNMPPELYSNEFAFIRYAGRYGINESDAKGLLNEINDYV